MRSRTLRGVRRARAGSPARRCTPAATRRSRRASYGYCCARRLDTLAGRTCCSSPGSGARRAAAAPTVLLAQPPAHFGLPRLEKPTPPSLTPDGRSNRPARRSPRPAEPGAGERLAAARTHGEGPPRSAMGGQRFPATRTRGSVCEQSLWTNEPAEGILAGCLCLDAHASILPGS